VEVARNGLGEEGIRAPNRREIWGFEQG
jgi:hypothetical protein